jgi:hypothetical protein
MMAVVVVDLAVLLASGSVKDVNFSVDGSLSFNESSDSGGDDIRFSRFLISTVVVGVVLVVVVGVTVST